MIFDEGPLANKERVVQRWLCVLFFLKVKKGAEIFIGS